MWIGDDAAVVVPAARRLLLTVDAVVEGVHADLALVGLDDLGWRSVSTAVSDIAAMGGCADQLARLGRGAAFYGPGAALQRDLRGGARTMELRSWAATCRPRPRSRWPSLSSATCRRRAARAALRGEAGDALVVTGPLGAAAAGLRILRDRVGAAGPGWTDASMQRP